jgi:molecular chaperone HscB
MKDHFVTLGIERKFLLENAALERRFHQLQRSSHPDRFAGADENVHLDALDRSSDINMAYRTLRDQFERTKHLLSLYGYTVENSKQVPMELLEVVMNVQEKIAELEFAPDDKRETTMQEIEPLANDLQSRREAIDEANELLKAKWDAAEHSPAINDLGADEKELLGKITKSLAERAYISTLLGTLEAAMKGESLVLKH